MQERTWTWPRGTTSQLTLKCTQWGIRLAKRRSTLRSNDAGNEAFAVFHSWRRAHESQAGCVPVRVGLVPGAMETELGCTLGVVSPLLIHQPIGKGHLRYLECVHDGRPTVQSQGATDCKATAASIWLASPLERACW